MGGSYQPSGVIRVDTQISAVETESEYKGTRCTRVLPRKARQAADGNNNSAGIIDVRLQSPITISRIQMHLRLGVQRLLIHKGQSTNYRLQITECKSLGTSVEPIRGASIDFLDYLHYSTVRVFVIQILFLERRSGTSLQSLGFLLQCRELIILNNRH